MLPQTYRFDLRSNPEFVTKSTRTETPYFRVYWANSVATQGAVIVSKHVSPLATKRNSLKRTLRTVVLAVLQENLGKTIVVYGKKKSLSTSYETLVASLSKVFSR